MPTYSCQTCGKLIPEPMVTYGIDPEALCKCCVHDRRPSILSTIPSAQELAKLRADIRERAEKASGILYAQPNSREHYTHLIAEIFADMVPLSELTAAEQRVKELEQQLATLSATYDNEKEPGMATDPQRRLYEFRP